MVKINRMNENENVELYAKLEGWNPGGSVKDRPVLKMIEEAEKKNLLFEKTIIEATSGNTGIALAMIGAVKGYHVEIIMPENASVERRKTIAAFGAKIILTPAKEGIDGAIRLANEKALKNPESYFLPDQYSNDNNPLAHYAQTAEEIWDQTDGKIDVFVAGIGTGGTVMGVGKALKEKNPKIEVIAAEPEPDHKIQGLKNMKTTMVPKIFRREKVDRTIYVNDSDSFQTARTLAKKEGIFVGISSGAAMWTAIQIANEKKKGRVVALLPDRGERYLSTDLFG
ncbi:Threonine synthase [Candidatus Bilamarchaeum dharawalense]|uniref:Threonine synthase n=1 Tax=Candidatus Bilamarchaeum dharawalense TaxID=2885759 RepID=A0A5E4LR90_9ARCH|nr:Threonine synthase [Candidatus Bilamarchaeum dharawalense]